MQLEVLALPARAALADREEIRHLEHLYLLAEAEEEKAEPQQLFLLEEEEEDLPVRACLDREQHLLRVDRPEPHQQPQLAGRADREALALAEQLNTEEVEALAAPQFLPYLAEDHLSTVLAVVALVVEPQLETQLLQAQQEGNQILIPPEEVRLVAQHRALDRLVPMPELLLCAEAEEVAVAEMHRE